MKTSTRNLVLGGLFLALGLLLPFLTAQVPEFGSRLLPMHIPVLLCGFLCGAHYGLLVGFITPLLRSLLFGMPIMFPMAVSMSFELAAYGFIAGILYSLLPRRKISAYIALIAAMLCGRLIWGVVSYILFGINGTAFSWEIFTAGAFINAIPGILIQLIIIPFIIFAAERYETKEYEVY
ncbi:MAG: ECF transporter S component [Anaerovoracaceae bacterium]|jgi:thiamine transporter ThiT